MPGETTTLNQVGFQALGVSGTAVGLTRPKNVATGVTEHPRRAMIAVSGGAIRWNATPGDPPGPGYGTYVNAGGTIDWTRMDTDYAGIIDNVKFVKAGAADAVLEVSFYG